MSRCDFSGRLEIHETAPLTTGFHQFFVYQIFPTAQLNSFTRYGHTNAEYYVIVAGTRISLYWDWPSDAWIDAAQRIQRSITAPEPASLLEI